MVEDSLGRAISLINKGEINQARKILVRLLRENPKLEKAWAWLHLCVETDEESIYCLQKVLEINPDNVGAKASLDQLNQKQGKLPENIVQTSTKSKRKRKSKSVLIKQEQENKPEQDEPEPKQKQDVPEPNDYKVVIIGPDENLSRSHYPQPYNFPEVDSGMFGTRLTIGGLTITPSNCPKCVEVGHILSRSQCSICDFFSFSDCPFRRNQYLLHETHILFSQYKYTWQEFKERRDRIIEAIYHELKSHGRPLHYEVITRIMKDRYPKLHLNGRKISRLMSWHPDKFEWVDRGVYRAK
jgi:tetratricopeptide (TPR) repeat protein